MFISHFLASRAVNNIRYSCHLRIPPASTNRKYPHAVSGSLCTWVILDVVLRMTSTRTSWITALCPILGFRRSSPLASCYQLLRPHVDVQHHTRALHRDCPLHGLPRYTSSTGQGRICELCMIPPGAPRVPEFGELAVRGMRHKFGRLPVSSAS